MRASWKLSGLLWLLIAMGCDPTTTTPTTSTPIVPSTSKPADSAVNSKTTLDPDQQKRDADMTAEIRKRMREEEKVSVEARDIKIVAVNGQVTLSGTVATAEEKELIERIAGDVAGKDHVASQLEVKS